MPQITLFAPDVTCDHCIATIQKAVGTVDGATFLEGDPGLILERRCAQ